MRGSGYKRDELTGASRRLRNAGLHRLYSSANAITIIKSGRMKLSGHVAHMEEKQSSYKVLVS
jgi:hypothetical protein